MTAIADEYRDLVGATVVAVGEVQGHEPWDRRLALRLNWEHDAATW